MSRLTGNDVVDMLEAYQAVYSPEEISEEQIWEEVEEWVNSLVEEGHDLSEFTWEEMYEAYIAEIGVNFGGQAAVDRARSQQKAKSASDAKLAALRTQRFGSGGSPSATKPAAKPSPSGTTSRFAGARDAAFAKAKAIKGSPVVGSGAKPSAAPAARPSATARPSAAPAAKPAAAAKPASTSSAKPAPTAAAKPAPTTTSKPITSQPPESKSQASAGEIRGMIGRSMERQASSTPAAAKPTPKPTPAATGSKKPGSVYSSFDMFDVVKGHLIDEGYADTEESAIAIMANMSEEWKASIIAEEQLDEISLKTKMSAFKKRATHDFESDSDADNYTKSGENKTDKIKANIVKKHGKKAGEHAERAAHAGIFGRKSFSMPKKP